MKKMIKVFSIVVFVMLIAFPLMAGGGGQRAQPQEAQGTIATLTITQIPARFDGKFVMLTLDTGGSGARNVAWGTRTINGTSVTINLLDWVTDQPTAIRDGNYGINIVLATNMNAIANDQHDFVGIIMVKALAGESVTVEWGEFMDMTN